MNLNPFNRHRRFLAELKPGQKVTVKTLSSRYDATILTVGSYACNVTRDGFTATPVPTQQIYPVKNPRSFKLFLIGSD